MRIMVKFQKTGAASYISHLDLMRAMQRTFRRGKLPIKYSQGFHPHAILSFATALPVGMESHAEYMELELTTVCSTEEILQAFKEAVPPGIEALQVVELQEETPSLMSLVSRADYVIEMEGFTKDVRACIQQYLEQPEIIALRTTKCGQKMTDIKKWIFELQGAEQKLFMQLACGSAGNLKPDLVVTSFLAFCGQTADVKIRRTALYADIDNKLTDFSSLQKEMVF